MLKAIEAFAKKHYTPKDKTKVYVVLGMHRSGTSLISRILSAKGVCMGDKLMGAAESNKYGHFEDMYFLRLNQILLGLLGGRWYNPPVISTGFKGLRKGVIVILKILFLKKTYKYSQNNKLWGFKDPRFTLTYGVFDKYLLNHEIIIVGAYRKPGDVVSSLVKRDNMTPSQALKIWKEYNLYLLYHLKYNRKNAICIEFDELLNRPKVIEKLINENIDGKDIKINDFLNQKENHGLEFDISYDQEAVMIEKQLREYSQ